MLTKAQVKALKKLRIRSSDQMEALDIVAPETITALDYLIKVHVEGIEYESRMMNEKGENASSLIKFWELVLTRLKHARVLFD